jgi:hypothetical protein
MPDFAIERLSLRMMNAAGHEHRAEDITARAVALIGDELVQLGTSLGGTQSSMALQPDQVTLNLGVMDNEAAARTIADSVLISIRMQVED